VKAKHIKATWERKPDESHKAYEAFSIYRDMGINRNVRAVAQKLNKSLTIIGRWSSRYNWVERAGAYDDYYGKLERQAIERGRIASKKKRIKILETYQDNLVEAMQNLDNNGASWSDITRGLAMVMRELRAEFGETKPNVEINNNVVSSNDTRAELLAKLERLRND